VCEQKAAHRAHHRQRPQTDGRGPAEWTHHSSYIHTPPAAPMPRPMPSRAGAGAAQADVQLTAMARIIYAACFPAGEGVVSFEEAERLDTIHYRRAIHAARAIAARNHARPDPVTG